MAPWKISSCRPTRMPDRSWSWLMTLASRVAACSTSWTQPTLTGRAQQVAQELDDTAIRAVADQRQADDHLAQPGLGHPQLEQHLAVRHGRREGISQCDAGLVRLLVDELVADPVPGCQVADRLRSRQRLNGQVLAVALGQPRRCASTSIHTPTTPENVRVPSSLLEASTRLCQAPCVTRL